MEQISSESRTALSHLLRAVGGTRSRTMSAKDIGTLFSRQKHFINLLSDKKLGKNVNIRNIIMACYTVHLATGHTLMCKTIASGTIKRYFSEMQSGMNEITNLEDEDKENKKDDQ